MGTINFFPKPLSLSSTVSSSLTKTVNGSHEFTIKGYSLNKGMGIGKHIASDTFKVGGYTWAVCFFPDGKCLEDNSVYVSLFVSLACDARDVRALFELSLVDQSGKGRDKVYSHFGKVLETGPYTLKSVGSMWGYKRFYKRTALEISDYIKDDCLLIRCTVGVVNSISAPKVHTIPLPPSDMGQCFGSLLESEEGADVKFEVDGEIFSAHKLVLATRSPVFKAQLYGPLKDGEKECIKVMEIEAPVFKALLHFIYWDIFPDNQVLLSPTWASNLMTRHLLAAADRYGIDRLRVICEAKLCDDIAVNNVATTLALAEQHQCIHLKAVCLRFIALSENLRAVMETDGFKYLKDSCPTVLSELLKLVARLGQYSTISLDGIKDEYALDGIKIEDALGDGTDINGRRVKQRID